MKRKQRRRSFRPTLDALESRQLLSVTAFKAIDLGPAASVGGINASGQVVGSDSGTRVSVSGPNGSLPLTPIIDTSNSYGNSINDSGYVTGGYDYQRGIGAFLYKPDSGSIDIGNLGINRSVGYGINNYNIVVGSSTTTSGEIHAFSYNPSTGKMTDLGSLGGQSIAEAINNNGDIIGSSGFGSFYYHNGVMRSIGQVTATALNDSGQVTGYAYGTNDFEAFLSDPNGGVQHKLGFLGIPQSINANGDIAGYYWTDVQGTTTNHGFFYDGTFHDLNNMVSLNPGWTIVYAKGINNSDQIAALAADSAGEGHALLLTPIVPQAPTITWAKPAPITYGTPLGSSQLDATASVPGTFSYTLADGKTPAAGAVLNIGTAQTLNVTFTPNDLVDYTPVTQTTTLDVNNPMIAGLTLNAYGDLQISGQLPSGNVISITPISGGWVKVTDNGVSAEFDASAINYIHYFGSLGGHDWFTNSIPLSGYVYAQMYGPGNTFVDSAQGTGAASYVILNGGYSTLIEAGIGHTYLWTNGHKTTDLLIGQNITIEN